MYCFYLKSHKAIKSHHIDKITRNANCYLKIISKSFCIAEQISPNIQIMSAKELTSGQNKSTGNSLRKRKDLVHNQFTDKQFLSHETASTALSTVTAGHKECSPFLEVLGR